MAKNYDDPCGIARALSLVGERWSLMVIRELTFGPRRFSDLARGLPTTSQNVLSQRLRDLQQEHVLRQRTLGPPTSTRVYELTERGRALKPVLEALGRWGSRLPLDPDGSAELSIDALALALVTMFDPQLAGELSVRVQLVLDDDRFDAEVTGGEFDVHRGECDNPDVTVTTDAAGLRSLVFAGRRLSAAVQSGEVQVVGRRALVERFLRCFPRPAPFDPQCPS